MVEEFLDISSILEAGRYESLRSEPFVKLESVLDVSRDVVKSDFGFQENTVDRWFEKDLFPIYVISEYMDRQEMVLRTRYITDCRDKTRFKPPLRFSQVKNPEIAYFVGVAAGDGGFNGKYLWSVVDGGKEHELEDSEKFIKQLIRMMERLFGLPKKSITFMERENTRELRINNKWFAKYLTNFIGLPESYKKEDLSKPDFIDNEEMMKAFWRGLFDTDGSIAKESNRVTLSSASRKFLEKCRDDLEELGVGVHEIRKPGSYQLRVSNNCFREFSEEIGFSHPRKRDLMLEKLEKGAREYAYRGPREENWLEDYYDLTQVSGLRVQGLGKSIKEYREEKGLYQKELAEVLDVSKAKVYNWENDRNAAPVDKLLEVSNSKKSLLGELRLSETKFKLGKRGRKSSYIDLPVKGKEEVEKLASRCVATSKEVRVRERSSETAERIEAIFDTEVRRAKNKYVVKNRTVYSFFKTFYRYERKFSPLEDDEREKLENRLKIDN